MSSDLASMEREELCHDRCAGLLLTGYIKTWVQPNRMRRRDVQTL